MAGIPPGAIEPVLSIVRAAPTPIRRRAILEALEARGHRLSLAGLNRLLEHCRQHGWVTEGPDGIRPGATRP